MSAGVILTKADFVVVELDETVTVSFNSKMPKGNVRAGMYNSLLVVLINVGSTEKALPHLDVEQWVINQLNCIEKEVLQFTSIVELREIS